jgi:hypothetical protein
MVRFDRHLGGVPALLEEDGVDGGTHEDVAAAADDGGDESLGNGR